MFLPNSKFLIIVCLALTACGRNNSARNSVHEIQGSAIERVARVTEIIGKTTRAPTAILDARFVEEQTGDGDLGPSDFRTFCMLEVAAQDLEKWIGLPERVFEYALHDQRWIHPVSQAHLTDLITR